jgi:hypothetical protein
LGSLNRATHDWSECCLTHTSSSLSFRALPRLKAFTQYIDPGLIASKGEPNPLLLDRLAKLAKRLKDAGGKMIFIMPPNISGLEVELLARRDVGPFVQRTKTVLGDWAAQNNLLIFDAGQSEQFACIVSEFVDAVHAVPECYRKVLGALWKIEGVSVRSIDPMKVN